MRAALPFALFSVAVVTLASAGVRQAHARGDEIDVAVAANFAGPLERIAREFEKDTGNHVVIATGATGTLFSQIEKGAPFDVLFAADEATPKRLEDDGFAAPGSLFTYAIGKLVLWSAEAGALSKDRGDGAETLKRGDFRHLAIANPKIAPYGAAAIAAMGALKVLPNLRPKLVQGESVAQAYEFVASGNAEFGFVALSQVVQQVVQPLQDASPVRGSYWIVPEDLYPPLKQDAVLLRRGYAQGRAPVLARASAASFCEYVRKNEKARAMIRVYGYGLAP